MCVRTRARAHVFCAYTCVSVNVCIKNVICPKCARTYRYSDNECNSTHNRTQYTSKPRQTTISHVTTLPLPPNISSLHRCPREQGKAIQTITSPHPTEITTVDRTTTSFG